MMLLILKISCNENVNNLIEESIALKNELLEILKLLAVWDVNKSQLRKQNENPYYANIVKNDNKVINKPKKPQQLNITKQMLNVNLKPKDFAALGVRNSKASGVIIECASSGDSCLVSVVNELGENY